jgi:hypothetical protein
MKKIKKCLLLLCFFNVIALYTNIVWAQTAEDLSGCPSAEGSSGAGAGADKGGSSGGGKGGGGGGEDYSWDDDDDDGGGDDQIDISAFFERLPLKGPCTTNKATKVLLSAGTWENFAQIMYGIDKSWAYFSLTGPITEREIAFFTLKRLGLLCNPSSLEDAIKVLEITKKCPARGGLDDDHPLFFGSLSGFDELTDYLRDPSQSLFKAQSEAQLRCYLSKVLGEEFSKCVMPAGQAVDLAAVRNAFVIEEYLKKNPQDKAWVSSNACLVIDGFNEYIKNCELLGGTNCMKEALEGISIATIFADKDFANAVSKAQNLLKNCGNTKEWSYLANFTPPQNVIDHVNSVNGASVQTINGNGSGPLINLDYFGLEICGLPKKANGQEMTKEELIDLIRKNISSYSGVNFSPKLDGYFDDEALYGSNNPLGSMVHIEIPGDNGSVVLSSYDSNGWIFTTVALPKTSDGTHPVSGNRQFSMYVDSNGKLQFFIKGADRVTDPFVGNSYFLFWYGINQADLLWQRTINNVANLIKSLGGCANNKPPIKLRPNWKKTYECWQKSKDLEKCIICE